MTGQANAGLGAFMGGHISACNMAQDSSPRRWPRGWQQSWPSPLYHKEPTGGTPNGRGDGRCLWMRRRRGTHSEMEWWVKWDFNAPTSARGGVRLNIAAGGIYAATKMAAYKRKSKVFIGTNNNVGRQQVNSPYASVAGKAQQRIPRRIFWLRLWSGVRTGTFRVRSVNNSADPMSRIMISQAAGTHIARWSASARHGRAKSWSPGTCISTSYPGDVENAQGLIFSEF